MLRGFRFLLALALALPTPAAAAPRPRDFLQPVESERGLVLVSSPGRAYVELSGRRRHRVSLHRSEQLTLLAELRRGWVAVGHREVEGGRDLVVVIDDAAGVRRLPPPPNPGGAIRLRGVPLTARGGFAGLAWLEGTHPRSLAVRAAEWTGAEWGPVEAVSQPGPGGQAGLTAATLSDGSPLLVWSAFDGHDTELVWSRRRGATWSDPRRVTGDNSGPDIAPALIATERGAVVAWSRLEPAGYRLVTAAFSGDSWGAPRPVAPPGSVFPSFVESAGRPYLLFQNAIAAGWTVLEVDRDGRPVRSASLATGRPERPLVSRPGGTTVTLAWPAARLESEILWEPAQ